MSVTRLDEGSYTTWNELKFIQYLGSWGIKRHVKSGATREELLERYLRSCKRRYHWGDIDRDAVMIEAARLLYEYKKEVKR